MSVVRYQENSKKKNKNSKDKERKKAEGKNKSKKKRTNKGRTFSGSFLTEKIRKQLSDVWKYKDKKEKEKPRRISGLNNKSQIHRLLKIIKFKELPKASDGSVYRYT